MSTFVRICSRLCAPDAVLDAQRETVSFAYRDYRHGSQRKELSLSALEFIRRFSLHILPPGLVRIRHYGILGNTRRKRAIEAARAIFKPRARAVELQLPNLADKPMCCPSCGKAGIRRWLLSMPLAFCT